MKSRWVTSMAALAVVGTVSAANAATVVLDFEGLSYNEVVSGPGVFADVIFSGSDDIVAYADISQPADFGGDTTVGYSSFEGDPFRADFLIDEVTAVSITIGDYGADADSPFIRAYDSGGNLLDAATDSIALGELAGRVLSVSSTTAIAYLLFGAESDFSNSVVFDNFTYTYGESGTEPNPNPNPNPGVIPTPSAALAGLVMATGALMRRRPA